MRKVASLWRAVSSTPSTPAIHPESDGEAGFSMLETIAALAILSMALIPILSLQSQLASGTARLDRQATRIRAIEVAESYLSIIDPYVTPEGSLNLGADWQMNWRSSTINTAQRARYGVGISSRYQSQLFLIDAQLISPSGRELALQRQAIGVLETAPFAGEAIN